MPNSIDFHKWIFLDVIPVRIIVPWCVTKHSPQCFFTKKIGMFKIVYKKTDEWYIEWQRVVQRVTTNDYEWKQQVQRVTTRDTTNDNE